MSWTPLDRKAPFEFIREAIRLFTERKGKVIIEIGCMRQRFDHPIEEEPEDCPTRLDGHSTVHYAATDAIFYSCDVNPGAVELAKEYTQSRTNTRILMKDGIKFLKNFGRKIDLLSLDAWDVDLSDCAEKHLEAYEACKRVLHKDTVVIIDDTDVSIIDGKLQPVKEGYGGKGRLLVPKMIEDGWRVVRSGRCTILVKA